MRQITILFLAAIAAPAIAATPVQPGQWEITTRVTDIQMADGPPGLAAMMRGKPMTIRHCITPAEAAQGPQTMMKQNKNCRFTSYSAVGGRLSSTMVCEMGASGRMTATSVGNYTPTSFSSTGKSVMTGTHAMTSTAVVSGKRVGNCS